MFTIHSFRSGGKLSYRNLIPDLIKGSLDAKVPSYKVLKMRANRCVENIDA